MAANPNGKPKPQMPPFELQNRTANVQPKYPNTVKVTSDPRDGNWQRWFDRKGKGMHPVRSNNHVIGLIDGSETFKSMVSAIVTATGNSHYIYMLNWWMNLDFELIPRYKPPGGSPSTKLIDLLSNAVKKGVHVRAMLWDQWGTQNSEEVKRINTLTNSAKPPANGAAILDNNTLNLGSHHQKILIVKGDKGLIAFCGGVDFNPDRIRSTSSQPGSPMRDVHCQIAGPAAWDLLNIFRLRWMDHPESVSINTKKGKLRGGDEQMPKGSSDKYVQIGCTYRNGSNHQGITNRFKQRFYTFAKNGERTAERMIFHAIGKARRFIYIEDQYLISMDASKKLRAALSNIDRLIILIPHSSLLSASGLSSGLPGVWKRRKKFIDYLKGDPKTSHKVAICYRIKAGSPVNSKEVQSNTKHTFIHSKIFIMDDKFAIIGSANCNNRGYTHDSEVVAGIFDEAGNGTVHFAHELRMRLWAEHLNLKKAAVFDPIASASNWLKPPAKSSIALYDQNADTDQNLTISDDVVDPFGG